jgi:hypothetical protein
MAFQPAAFPVAAWDDEAGAARGAPPVNFSKGENANESELLVR